MFCLKFFQNSRSLSFPMTIWMIQYFFSSHYLLMGFLKQPPLNVNILDHFLWTISNICGLWYGNVMKYSILGDFPLPQMHKILKLFYFLKLFFCLAFQTYHNARHPLVFAVVQWARTVQIKYAAILLKFEERQGCQLRTIWICQMLSKKSPICSAFYLLKNKIYIYV